MQNVLTQKYRMTKEITKMRNRGDITIPVNIRKQLDLQVGDHLLLIPNGDTIVLKKLKL